MLSHIQLSDTEIEQVNQILQEFIGLPLTDVWGDTYFMRFEFGEQFSYITPRGFDSSRANMAIDAFEPSICEIRGPDGFSYAMAEYLRRVQFPAELDTLMDSNLLVLEEVNLQSEGQLTLGLAKGFSIKIEPHFESSISDGWLIKTPAIKCYLNERTLDFVILNQESE